MSLNKSDTKKSPQLMNNLNPLSPHHGDSSARSADIKLPSLKIKSTANVKPIKVPQSVSNHTSSTPLAYVELDDANKKDLVNVLKHELEIKNNRLQEAEMEIVAFKETIKEKDVENEKLKRELDKLRSVLQQTFPKQDLKGKDLIPRDASPKSDNSLVLRLKKQGVSGESGSDDASELQRFEKDPTSRQKIKDAILENDLLKSLEQAQVKEMVECMYEKRVAAGSFVIKEGEPGQHLYVSSEGQMEVSKDGKLLGRMESWKSFGELALLYNCNRTASVKALTNARLWVLNRRTFQIIMRRTGLLRQEEYITFLRSVPLFKQLQQEKISKIADALEVEIYSGDQRIVGEGDIGDTFFIIKSGSVKVTQTIQGHDSPQEIRNLTKGDYFGEKALLSEDRRTANVYALPPSVEVLILDRDSFSQLIGDLDQLKEKDYGDEKRGAQRTTVPKSTTLSTQSASKITPQLNTNVQEDNFFATVSCEDFEIKATLGIGGFGRVQLVVHKTDKNKVFALKCLKKKHIVDTKQQEHVHWEKKILLESQCPFICRLYKTFRDERMVYMLLEVCLGGELWTILRNKGQFNDNITRFVVACVLEAFDYLHCRNIIYRDLKPENLLLDANGYVKLCDFGFAKAIGLGKKTWTFCGTPEYVAPEIVLNKGHDFAADYWSMGVLMFELLTGSPPFVASDPMKIYSIILKGIECITFPKTISKNANALIKKLCKENACERLGYGKGGISEIRKSKFLQGFEWKALISRTMIPPIVPKITSPTDSSNFDPFGSDNEIPPIENSGWDVNF